MRGIVLLISIMTVLIFVGLGAVVYGVTKKSKSVKKIDKSEIDISIIHDLEKITTNEDQIIINDGNKKLYIIDIERKKHILTVNINDKD